QMVSLGSGAITRVGRFAAIVSTLILCTACSMQTEPRVVYITATPGAASVLPGSPTTEAQEQPQVFPTQTLALSTAVASAPTTQQHTVAAGETLFAIAQQYNTTVETIVEMNNLENPDIVFVGQVLDVPSGSSLVTPNLILLSDTRLVRGP